MDVERNIVGSTPPPPEFSDDEDQAGVETAATKPNTYPVKPDPASAAVPPPEQSLLVITIDALLRQMSHQLGKQQPDKVALPMLELPECDINMRTLQEVS